MPIRSPAFKYWLHAAGAAFAAASMAAAGAQTVPDASQPGLRLQPGGSAELNFPVYGNWGIRSSVGGLRTPSGEGLKFGVAGTYGWNFDERARLALAAGVVNVERPGLLPGMAVGVNRLHLGGGALGVDARDLNFNLSLDWRYSNGLTLYTGLDISYSLADPQPIGWQSVVRPSNSTGFVGLKYRF